MWLVREHLFLGDITDAANALRTGGGSEGITHVLSLLSTASISFFSDWRPGIVIPAEETRTVLAGDHEYAARRSLPPHRVLYGLERAGMELKVLRMAVPLRDIEDENLLDYLDVCLDFIDRSRKEGGVVLVHCFAGVSRSGAVLTAYLMKSEQKSAEDALESLKKSRDVVSPNEGFVDQLALFEEMGFKVDIESTIYKRFRLKMLGHSFKLGEAIDASILGDDPGSVSESKFSPVRKGTQGKTLYSCKKCRRVVALEENVVSHLPGEKESTFIWGKDSFGVQFNEFQDIECTSLFVEPLKWMTAVKDGALEGKLSCIKCDARLGHFNWTGTQCSCGSWISPAFQIHKSKVDMMRYSG